MTGNGVILYGPPASGKDAVTSALLRLSKKYELFEKLKIGGGRHHGYRLTCPSELELLRTQRLILYENCRYGNTYAVDSPGLDKIVGVGRVPVVHMGQVRGVEALLGYQLAWLPVLLWCPRLVTAGRLRKRGTTDLRTRLRVWDQTLEDLSHSPPAIFALSIRTDLAAPTSAAETIHARLTTPAERR